MIRGLLLSVGLLLMSTSLAEAKFFVITVGDTVHEYGPVVAGRTAKMPPGLQVGYKYNYFGICWLDLYTHSGEYCLFENGQYEPISEAEAAAFLGKSDGRLATPFWYRFPSLLCILIGLSPFVLIGLISQSRRKQKYGKLMENEDYRDALFIAVEPIRSPAEGVVDEKEMEKILEQANQDALEYLAARGIEAETAKQNLDFMVNFWLEKRK